MKLKLTLSIDVFRRFREEIELSDENIWVSIIIINPIIEVSSSFIRRSFFFSFPTIGHLFQKFRNNFFSLQKFRNFFFNFTTTTNRNTLLLLN
ncbi:hypothetical protein AQUCO_00400536v1 [Aquilegia coerulea]|uniref:Uncharacterized protein n=1 Tax=Aquilegia coerulea TaxID=218851 RepID=A0A2G5EVD8_AQUCA|nr:hypothetical protein AQUCO_00400536v1 [Aquilegia coerulea]